MRRKTHQLEFLATVRSSAEYIGTHFVRTTADNRHFAVCMRDAFCGTSEVFHDGILRATFDSYESSSFSLSPDGLKLAVWIARGDSEREMYFIEVNGERRYQTEENQEVINLVWLTDTDLAWNLRTEIGGKPITYLNGERHPTMEIASCLNVRMEPQTLIRDGETGYCLGEDGVRDESWNPVKANVWWNPGSYERRLDKEQRRMSARPTIVHAQGTETCFVAFNELLPEERPAPALFYNIKQIRCHTLASSEKVIGYVGEQYPFFVVQFAHLAGRVAKYMDEKPKEKKGHSRIRHALLWAAAMLFNPYCGAGYVRFAESKRSYPVWMDRPWKKGYRFISDLFFTPNGELGVVAETKRDQWAVVLNEEEGPRFDQIYHVRCTPDEISYIGRRDWDFYRVSIT